MINSEALQQIYSGTNSRNNSSPELVVAAARTAFVSRFIVLREGRRSRAHRTIEALQWSEESTAEELYELFRNCFIENGDKLTPVDRDLNRALEHANTSAVFFVHQYIGRTTLCFKDALIDYEKSNAFCLVKTLKVHLEKVVGDSPQMSFKG